MNNKISYTENLPGQSDIFGFLNSIKPVPIIEELIEQASSDVETIAESIIQQHVQPLTSENLENDLEFVIQNNNQLSFVDRDEWWKEHWMGMPEFNQGDIRPWKSIFVHFRSYDDLRAFAELIGQRVTSDTRFFWYPFMPRENRSHCVRIWHADTEPVLYRRSGTRCCMCC